MLDIKWIRENPQALAEALVKRQWSAEKAESTVEDLIRRDEARRAHLGRLQERQERRNAASKEIGNAMRSGDSAKAEELKGEVNEIKTFLAGAEAMERDLDKALEDALAVLPNVPLADVPVGADEHDNVEVRKVGEIKPRSNWTREHFEIGETLGMMDFERAAKLSGSRFTVLKGGLARLERALGQFMLDLHTTEHGYTEVQPPLLVRDDALYGTGQLPKFEEDLFFTDPRTSEWADQMRRRLKNVGRATLGEIAGPVSPERLHQIADVIAKNAADIFLIDDYFATVDHDASPRLAKRFGLIPTAEVPLTNLVREEITAHEKLPLRYTALTPCFRSEAGSAGRDTRGMLRQHQFYKVELVSITDQDSSAAEHERMTECAETVLKKLGLPFRTVALCTGDMGFGAQKTYDIEVWLPGQNAYREISSCSVCGDFQGRRMNARYKAPGEKTTRFVHTLNGSGTAVGRALIAVMENYQEADGSVTIPEALRPYMGGLTKIEAR
jgi:seryl-tRNA synthetase